jgi:hypothetical protein
MTIDHETAELLRDEPELLAIADALQSAGERLDVAAPRRARRRLPVRAAAVVLAIAAAIALVLASPWSDSAGPSFVEKALAAVGDKPVLHVVLEYQLGERIELRTGRVGPVVYRAELWYDADRHVYRSVTRLDGRVVSKTAGTGSLATQPFLLSDLYRHALEQGKVHQTGEAVIRGRKAIVVEARQSGGGGVARAYLDAATYQLLRMQYLLDGKLASQMDVLRYETVGRGEAHLPTPAPGPVPSGGPVTGSSSGGSSGGLLSPAEAHSVFTPPALWAGESVDGQTLGSIELETVTDESGGQSATDRKLLLPYGADVGSTHEPYLEVEEAPADSTLWTLEGVHAPPAGYLDLTSAETSTGGSDTRTEWTGVMQQDGFVLQLTSVDRATLLAGARALRPLP